MISITDAAQQHFVNLLTKQDLGTQIRIFVTNPGTPNAECGISFCPPSTIEDSDIKLTFNKFFAYVDECSAFYLKDAMIDFITDKFGTQLTLKAPNVNQLLDSSTPLIERIQYIISYKINPQLANHGGKVIFLDLTEDMFVILEFSGGCNGCSMVGATLKQYIEKQLINIFPELKGVRDVTDHNHSENSYY
ncbi:Fe-S biogenesis protein NfuA [Candidatus Palibaumannia cicadellinicola]|uniref:Fe/S biogenesis protein NfuA n=1 Tax=Candidatus Palibaumannia cicadellinicola TaxID=186490 RepID=A0A0K2BLG3_9GAMM|nr:Fe-S biogenesis protein NfuA [Candidatus Baumannia cicadellinicola]AKZ66019.1 NfuA Fe-S protein maturation [Candidatus Baumannia cicadellinicola]